MVLYKRVENCTKGERFFADTDMSAQYCMFGTAAHYAPSFDNSKLQKGSCSELAEGRAVECICKTEAEGCHSGRKLEGHLNALTLIWIAVIANKA